MLKHYVIGDVHGEYEMLMALMSKLPEDARVFFVGDLVNRGKNGKKVMEFVRNHAYGVVKGNHEVYMLFQAKQFFSLLNKNKLYDLFQYVGGSPILQPYKIVKRDKSKTFSFNIDEERLEELKRDLRWIKTLSVTLELESIKGYDKPIVLSHASVGDYWHLRESNRKDFEYHALSNRFFPSKQSPIFNIFGHLAVDEVVKEEDFVCVDTGCAKRYDAKLSAYCIETKEVVDVTREESLLLALESA